MEVKITLKEGMELKNALRDLQHVTGLGVNTMIKICELEFAVEKDIAAYQKAKNKILTDAKIEPIPEQASMQYAAISLDSGVRILLDVNDILKYTTQFEGEEARELIITSDGFTKKEFDVEKEKGKSTSVLTTNTLRHLYKFLNDGK